MNELNERFGNGGKWYLNPENYAPHYLEDEQRRQYIADFYADMGRHDARGRAANLIREDAGLPPTELEEKIRLRMARQKEIHYGQVVPVEEIEQILRMSGCIMRFACLCRYMYEDKAEFRSCYLVGAEPGGGKLKEIMDSVHAEYLNGDTVQGVELVTAEEAIRHFREMDKMGLVHTVWTMRTPFTASICNCDPVHCAAMYTSVMTGHNGTEFMADYIAEIDDDACVGCRRCKMACQFGALDYSPLRKKVQVDAARCIGCGLCRTQCAMGNIRLVDRESNPISAGRYEMRDRRR